MRFDGRNCAESWGKLLFALACAWFGAGVAQGQPVPGASEITAFHEFYSLPAERAQKNTPVRIKGVVLCYDLGWNQLYVHDGIETAWLSPQLFPTNLQTGLEIEITGGTTIAQGAPVLTNLHLQVLGHGAIPKPKRLEIPQLGSDYGQWVETRGRVRVAETSPGRLSLVVQANGRTCLVYVMSSTSTNDASQLIGCEAWIRGINASKSTGGRLEAASVFAPGLNGITIIERAKAKPAEDPIVSVESLLDRELGPWTNELVHLRGVITSYKPGESLVIKDATGSVRAQVIQTTLAQADERADVWGYLSVSPGENVLRGAYFAVRAATLNVPSVAVSQPPADQREITRFTEVSKMRPEEASKGMRVRLQGTVTFADPDWRNCFVQSQDGAIYVDLNQRDVGVGQWVEVTGQTSDGGFAPEVVNSNIRLLGTTNLPVAVKADLEDAADGHLDSRWVQMEGVVRRVSEQWGHVTLVLMTPKGRFRAIVLKASDQPVPSGLIDAQVSIRGACTSEMNAHRQLNGVALHVPSFEQVRIMVPVPADPFGVPATPISSVGTFDATRLAGRRLKVAGSVTQIIPGKGFYIQDASGGILVNSAQANDLQVGDTVHALGFPVTSDFSPFLEEVTFLRTGRAPLPKPQIATAEEILLHGAHDAALVQIDARLVQNVHRSAQPKLVLQSGPIIFNARMLPRRTGAGEPAGMTLPSLKIGSVVRLTGVCVIQGGESREAETFRLLLSGPQNVVLLNSPPWWSVAHTAILMGSLALGALLAWGWSRALRLQVRAQTEVIHRNQEELMTVSRQAGMAEVATGVLHNVGNVLNSVNVSVDVLGEALRRSRVGNLKRVADLLESHRSDLPEFLTTNPQGRQVLEFLSHLAIALEEERANFRGELKHLQSNVEHIKEIVTVQQSYATVAGINEDLPVVSLIEDAIRMNETAFQQNKVMIKRTFADVPLVRVDKHKVLQILVNLFRNAKYAMAAAGKAEKVLSLSVSRNASGQVEVVVSDNGIGIAPENLTRVFSHGFTTKKDGHGFGLHSGALAAKEMGGSLRAFSDGPGKGATFILELPIAATAQSKER